MEIQEMGLNGKQFVAKCGTVAHVGDGVEHIIAYSCAGEVDAITGPLIGRPRTASYRLADLAGIDIMADVAENLYNAVPDDESRAEFSTARTPPP